MKHYVPKKKLRQGVGSGDFVPLDVAEFREGLATVIAVSAGNLPYDPNFPVGDKLEVETVGSYLVDDTPYNRALHTAGALFATPAQFLSAGGGGGREIA